jgi:hypothetical protein
VKLKQPTAAEALRPKKGTGSLAKQSFNFLYLPITAELTWESVFAALGRSQGSATSGIRWIASDNPSSVAKVTCPEKS